MPNFRLDVPMFRVLPNKEEKRPIDETQQFNSKSPIDNRFIIKDFRIERALTLKVSLHQFLQMALLMPRIFLYGVNHGALPAPV